MRGFLCRLPQTIMGRQVAIGGIQFCQPVIQHQEMAGLVIGDTQPVVKKGARQVGTCIAAGHVERKVNGVQFDMGDGMQQGNAPAGGRPDTPARHIAGRFQFRPGRASRPVWWRGGAKSGNAAIVPTCHKKARLPGLFHRIGDGKGTGKMCGQGHCSVCPGLHRA